MDLPRWSTAPYVQWASVGARGERLIVIDVPGGAADRLLHDSDVATILNDRFSPIFLHPRARPELTARFGWPSLTALDEDGCVRMTTPAPPDPPALVERLNEALRARRDGVRAALPAAGATAPSPPEPALWTADDPQLASAWTDPVRGRPALVQDGRPWLWPSDGPHVHCPLPNAGAGPTEPVALPDFQR